MNETNEVIEVQSSSGMSVVRDPNIVLAEAKKAAEALMQVVNQKPNPVIMNGQKYLEFEDWQTVAQFYGLSAKVTKTNFVEFGGVRGYEATADCIRNSDGMVLSSADAMCLNDEDKWSTRSKYEYQDVLDESGKKIWIAGKGDKKGYYKSEKVKVGDVAVPLFQLRSMAQTRACAKVFRNKLAWVVVLAGFRPTVAEEMTGDEHIDEGTPTSGKPEVKQPKEKSAQEYKDIVVLAQSNVGDILNVTAFLVSIKESTTKAPHSYVVGDLPKEPTAQITIKCFGDLIKIDPGQPIKFNQVTITEYQGKKQATAKEVVCG